MQKSIYFADHISTKTNGLPFTYLAFKPADVIKAVRLSQFKQAVVPIYVNDLHLPSTTSLGFITCQIIRI